MCVCWGVVRVEPESFTNLAFLSKSFKKIFCPGGQCTQLEALLQICTKWVAPATHTHTHTHVGAQTCAEQSITSDLLSAP